MQYDSEKDLWNFFIVNSMRVLVWELNESAAAHWGPRGKKKNQINNFFAQLGLPALPRDLRTLVRHDNARHHGKCRLITPSAISRYKVDGRRALKPPLGPASTSRAGSPPFRFTVSHRLSPGDATRPAAGHEAGGRAERLANARKPRSK